MTEPFGHRGHPTEFEVKRARKLSSRIERVIGLLEKQEFSRDEAIAFIAGTAFDRARATGETWSSPSNARDTVERMLAGRGAKEWSISAVILALIDIAAVLED